MNEFCKNSQALKVINSVCGSVSKGNCRGKKRHLDVEMESRPLRKRCKAKFRDQKTYSKLIQPPTVFKSKLKPKSRKLKKPTAPRKGLFKKQNVSASSLPTVNKSISNDVTTATMSDGTVTLTSCKNSVAEASQGLSISPPSSQEACFNNHIHTSTRQQKASVEMDIVGLDEPSNCKTEIMETLSLKETVSFEDEMISAALGAGSPEEELSRCCGMSIRRQDIWTLKDAGWLNDQVRKCVSILKHGVICSFFL